MSPMFGLDMSGRVFWTIPKVGALAKMTRKYPIHFNISSCLSDKKLMIANAFA